MFDELLAKEAKKFYVSMRNKYIRTDYKPATIQEYVFQLYVKDLRSGTVRHRMSFYGL